MVTAQHRPELKSALDAAWTNFADGEPVAWMMPRLGQHGARRVPGPDLMPNVMDVGRSSGLRHFLYGSTSEVLEPLEASLHRRYPGVRITGRLSPPFRLMEEDEERAIASKIRMSDVHIVWVGLGLPKQDEWMWRNAPRLAPCMALGVGAAFDFLAGTKQRALGCRGWTDQTTGATTLRWYL